MLVARARRHALLPVVVLAGAHGLWAQAPNGGAIAGRVVDDRGNPVPYASIVAPQHGAFTARDDGSFRIAAPSGTAERLVVRQIGFHPESLMVTASPSGAAGITVTLRRNPIHLDAVTVRALGTCAAEAIGDSTARAQLQPVFDALQENVSRSLSLLQVYPVEDRVTLTLYDSTSAGRRNEKTMSGTRWADGRNWMPYVPGKVVERRLLHRPIVVPVSTGFFVDSTFRARHCFRYTGDETVDGRQLVRIDFTPNRLVTEADWSGAVLLDARSYVVRELRSSLVYPAAAQGRLLHSDWFTSYAEIFPGLVDVAQTWHADWEADAPGPADGLTTSVTEMHVLGRTFPKGAPGGATP